MNVIVRRKVVSHAVEADLPWAPEPWRRRQVGLWVNITSYTVEALAPGTPTPREFRLMLQTLLEERFALKLRIDNTTNQMNTIVVDRPDGKLGPNVKPWDGTCMSGKPTVEDDPARPRCPSGYFPGRLLIDGGTMFSVAEALSLLPQGRPLVGDIPAIGRD